MSCGRLIPAVRVVAAPIAKGEECKVVFTLNFCVFVFHEFCFWGLE